MLECLRLAIQAPTGGNSQGWRWLVIDDADDARRRSPRSYRKRANPYLDGYRQLAPDATNPVLDSSRVPHRAPARGAGVRDPVHPRPSARTRPSNEEGAGFYGSILPAVWNFQLALRSRGLGSVFTTLHLAYEREAGEILGIPETVTQAALIPVAYTVGDDFKPAQRRAGRGDHVLERLETTELKQETQAGAGAGRKVGDSGSREGGSRSRPWKCLSPAVP